MVRIIPSRLKPSGGAASSGPGSRSTSPLRKPDSAGLEGPGLALKVVILKARNLAAKDRHGTSDPYLVLSLGDAKHVTHSVPKSLNPEWNEICLLPINGIPALVLDVFCWDKDRFGKDYLGEFDLALEEIFINDSTEQEPKWYPLKSKRPGKKTSVVSGEVLLQFTLVDQSDKCVPSQQLITRFNNFIKSASEAELAGSASASKLATKSSSLAPATAVGAPSRPPLIRQPSDNDEDEDEDVDADDDDLAPEDEDPSKPETAEKRKRRLRIKGIKRKRRNNPYEFVNGGSDVLGIIFLEIKNISDLPPESNFTKTSFDMDPFVVASLGRKTYRTKTIRHNLNPVFNEKLVFQVLSNEQSYSLSFTVIDHDKYSGNDFIASTSVPIKEFIERAPKADPETGLYELRDVPDYVPQAQRGRFKRLGLSRSSSAQSLAKVPRQVQGKASQAPLPPSNVDGQGLSTPLVPVQSNNSQDENYFSARESGESGGEAGSSTGPLTPGGTLPALVTTCSRDSTASASATPVAGSAVSATASGGGEACADDDDPEFSKFTLPLKMKNLEKWEDRHNPQLVVRAKYMPYPALRQQFWRAMLKQYDTDESGHISKVELSTMLDTLGSTLRESTIDSFFQRFPHKAAAVGGSGNPEEYIDNLTMDEAVICLEDQLQGKSKPQSTGATTPAVLDPASAPTAASDKGASAATSAAASTLDLSGDTTAGAAEDGDDLNDRGEEHVVEIRECPICHQPRLNKRKDADIITHIATCASQDWRQVNSLVMNGFVTANQAQRKWFSKVITKISYGGYRIGANSANILVQDRITGQINEEKMSVYVRLGIRLLYKGLRSNNMENRQIRKLLKDLSIKQGRKYDDPASKTEIQKFIEFHRLDMSEVLLPLEEFKTFNEFFYRALKPGARPCSAPNNPHIIVSPADCRSVVFDSVSTATRIWIKGREFTVKRLLGDAATAEDLSRYENGALGIFRLAPQDYHRFHIPVDGVLGPMKTIAGEYYTVNPMAIRSALDVYGENVRVVVPIESEVHGRVMVICVGAMMVGSTVITRKPGERVRRAEELGYFQFGGSTIVLLFEEGRMKFDHDLVENSNGALETLIRVGMSVGHSPNEPQWKGDMPKDGKDITEQDKLEAKRRIQGSATTEDNSPDDSGGDDLLHNV